MTISLQARSLTTAALCGAFAAVLLATAPTFAYAQYADSSFGDPSFSDAGMWGGSDSSASSLSDPGMWGGSDYSAPSPSDPNMWNGTDLSYPDTCTSCGLDSTTYTYSQPSYVDTVTPVSSYDYYTPTYTAYDTYTPYYASAYIGSGYGYSAPSRSTSNTSTYAPTTYTYANNGNSCTASNSCNTTISSPTTVTTSGGGGSYPVYYPTYYSTPTYYNPPTYYNYGYNYPVYSNPAPTCYLSASSNYVSGGQAVTLYWSSTNATYGTISNLGSVSPSGSRLIYPYQNMNYVGTFSGPGGTTNCYATVNVSGSGATAVPYVTLSQVPYTGLDLGPAGTAFYWLFLVLWCAIGAYLIAVKKVHNGLIARMQKLLLGDENAPRHPAYRAQMAPAAVPAGSAAASAADATDSFILAQVNRARR